MCTKSLHYFFVTGTKTESRSVSERELQVGRRSRGYGRPLSSFGTSRLVGLPHACRSVSAAFVSALGAAPRVLSNLALESKVENARQPVFYKGETRNTGNLHDGAVPPPNRSFGTFVQRLRVETATYSQFCDWAGNTFPRKFVDKFGKVDDISRGRCQGHACPSQATSRGGGGGDAAPANLQASLSSTRAPPS